MLRDRTLRKTPRNDTACIIGGELPAFPFKTIEWHCAPVPNRVDSLRSSVLITPYEPCTSCGRGNVLLLFWRDPVDQVEIDSTAPVAQSEQLLTRLEYSRNSCLGKKLCRAGTRNACARSGCVYSILISLPRGRGFVFRSVTSSTPLL